MFQDVSDSREEPVANVGYFLLLKEFICAIEKQS